LHFALYDFAIKLAAMLRNDYTLSKRMLGILMLVGGILGIIAILAIDVLDVGREGGIGPAQQIALGLCGVVVLLGLTLIPLGDDPA
jgi:hypothetical protein